MGKIPTNSLGKSSELKLHCFCLYNAYSMPKDIYSVNDFFFKSGNLVSLRGNMYYFHGYSSDTDKMLPVYQIFENGTSLELPFDPPFEKELAKDHDLFALNNPIKTALYYRRFYTKMN